MTSSKQAIVDTNQRQQSFQSPIKPSRSNADIQLRTDKGSPTTMRNRTLVKSRTRSSSGCCCLPVASASPASQRQRFRSVSPKISAKAVAITTTKTTNITDTEGKGFDNTSSTTMKTKLKTEVVTANVFSNNNNNDNNDNSDNSNNDDKYNNVNTDCYNNGNRNYDDKVAGNNLCDQMRLLKFENSAKRCRKLLKCNGHPNKIYLYPEEGWARNASTSYWTLVPFWWNCGRCKITEIAGTKRHTTYAKMSDMDNGNLYIRGSFKKCPDPDFKLTLTSNVSLADFNLGYCMIGSLERGCRKLNNYQTTHFAVIKRAEFNKQ